MRAYFPVTVRTHRCYTDGSHMNNRFGTLTVYCLAGDRQMAEDVTRDWLCDLSDTARIYTPEGKPKRALGGVQPDLDDSPAVAIAPRGKFVIIPPNAAFAIHGY